MYIQLIIWNLYLDFKKNINIKLTKGIYISHFLTLIFLYPSNNSSFCFSFSSCFHPFLHRKQAKGSCYKLDSTVTSELGSRGWTPGSRKLSINCVRVHRRQQQTLFRSPVRSVSREFEHVVPLRDLVDLIVRVNSDNEIRLAQFLWHQERDQLRLRIKVKWSCKVRYFDVTYLLLSFSIDGRQRDLDVFRSFAANVVDPYG